MRDPTVYHAVEKRDPRANMIISLTIHREDSYSKRASAVEGDVTETIIGENL